MATPHLELELHVQAKRFLHTNCLWAQCNTQRLLGGRFESAEGMDSRASSAKLEVAVCDFKFGNK